jgi:hypothetical protein
MWSAQRVPTAVKLCFLDRSRYLVIQVAPQLTSRGWVDPVPDPPPLRKSGSPGNRTRNLWICSQEPWPLDHRGGLINAQHLFIIFIHAFLEFSKKTSGRQVSSSHCTFQNLFWGKLYDFWGWGWGWGWSEWDRMESRERWQRFDSAKVATLVTASTWKKRPVAGWRYSPIPTVVAFVFVR